MQTVTPWLIGLAAGLVLGLVMHAWYARSRLVGLQKQLRAHQRALVEAHAWRRKAGARLETASRQERMAQLALTRAQEAIRSRQALVQLTLKQQKAYFIEKSRLRLAAANAVQHARRASRIAQSAVRRLELLERSIPPTQTIQAPEPKSYGSGDSVPVRVVEQWHEESRQRRALPVSNRDSARFTQLRSSNEPLEPAADGLHSVVDGCSELERQLNRYGIHSCAQLADLSESEAVDLQRAIGAGKPAKLVVAAREVMSQESSR